MKSGFRCLSISILPCVRVDVEVAACESSLSSLESVQDIGRLHSVGDRLRQSGISPKGNYPE